MSKEIPTAGIFGIPSLISQTDSVDRKVQKKKKKKSSLLDIKFLYRDKG